MHATEPAERRWTDHSRKSSPSPAAPRHHQAFHHPGSSISPIVHVLKTAAMLSPLVLSEFVKDPNKQFKYTRMAILGATLIDQVMWATKVSRDAKERQHCQETLWTERCRSSSALSSVPDVNVLPAR